MVTSPSDKMCVSSLYELYVIYNQGQILCFTAEHLLMWFQMPHLSMSQPAECNVTPGGN